MPTWVKCPESSPTTARATHQQTFAKEVVKLDANDYVEFISVTDAPYYTKSTLMVPDNWALQPAWNIPVTTSPASSTTPCATATPWLGAAM
jgi:bleomycin hydrolase